jgi:hypothetical protein
MNTTKLYGIVDSIPGSYPSPLYESKEDLIASWYGGQIIEYQFGEDGKIISVRIVERE